MAGFAHHEVRAGGHGRGLAPGQPAWVTMLASSAPDCVVAAPAAFRSIACVCSNSDSAACSDCVDWLVYSCGDGLVLGLADESGVPTPKTHVVSVMAIP